MTKMLRGAALAAMVAAPGVAWGQAATSPLTSVQTPGGGVPAVVQSCPAPAQFTYQGVNYAAGTYVPGGMFGTTAGCGGAGGSSTAGTQSSPNVVTPQAPAQTAAPAGSIATANTYQQVFAAGTQLHGGCLQNLGPANTNSMFVDWSSGIAAGGTTLSNGSMQVDSPSASGKVGGSQCWPATSNAVMVYGPAGTTFHAQGG